ncbi:MAG: hypothetical protein ACK559_31500, partial [bacterium]
KTAGTHYHSSQTAYGSKLIRAASAKESTHLRVYLNYLVLRRSYCCLCPWLVEFLREPKGITR